MRPGAPSATRMRTQWLLLAAVLLSALAVLAMAAFDRFQADSFEQHMRPLRQLGVARAELAPQVPRQGGLATDTASPGADQTARANWLHLLERLAVLGSMMAAQPVGIPNTLADQARALHTHWASADLARAPGREGDDMQAALTSLLQEIDRVELRTEDNLAQLRESQKSWYAAGWTLLAAALVAAGLLARHWQRLWHALQASAHEAQAQHWRMLDILPQLIWICDANAKADFLNHRWVQFSGQPMDQLIGEGWLGLVHPDDIDRVIREWRDAQASGAEHLPDFRLRRADGSYRWCNARFGVARDEQGRPVRWFGTSMDIHNVYEAHEALKRSEQFHRSTLAALNEGVITFDDQARVTGSNPAAQRMLGLRADQLQGAFSPAWGLVLKDQDGQPLTTDKLPTTRVLATGQAQRDQLVAVTRADGLRTWVCVNAEPVHGGPDGALSAIVCSFGDVSAQRREHEASLLQRGQLESEVDARTRELQVLNLQLQETERFARLVADSVPGRLVYWDSALRCRFVNRTQSEWFGEAPEQVIGRTLREIRGNEFVERAAGRINAALAGETLEFEQVEYSVRGVRADTRVQYIPDRREGEVKGFVVLATNVTRHKQAEQLLRLRNEQLEQARDRADAANDAKTTFLANMSHEIRTPMNAILGFTHMLRRDIEDPVQQQRLGRIAGAAGHLLQVINDILDLSKIEAGKLTLDRSDFSLDALLARTSAMVTESVRVKNLELVVFAEPVPDLLHGDSTRLMQALLNLLSNAVKFTERGVITLRVELLSQNKDELMLRFEVRDTGIGVGPEALAQLFTPFAQADASRTREHGGTGLGLAITRRIAEQMGGEASGHSTPGQGSRFWFTARLGLAERQETTDLTALAGLRALVVDDLPEAREALADMTRSLGLRVDSADSGEQALEQVAHAAETGAPYDLVLLDWAMPGLDGLQTGARLSEAAQPPRAMVLVSANERASIHQLARDAGFGAVLMKPVTSWLYRDALLRLLAAAPPAGAAPVPQERARPQLSRTAGARILLAEDNPVNQEVAVQLLEAAGVTVEVAADGEEALQMALSRPYDLVLMDMQMPRMDGLEATRRMRQEPTLAHLPIVAMTANAFPEDRQACLDAGMNDHLAKPVDPRVLQAALVRWLPAPLESSRVPAPAPLPPPEAAPQDVPAPVTSAQILARMADLVDLPQALEYAAGQPDILLRVLQQFVAHYRDMGATLVAQLAAGDREGPARSLHSLRGVSGMIGAGRVREMTTSLELALVEGAALEGLHAPAAALRAELDALVGAVADRLG
ncbi:hypothetical protein ASF43_11465 [Pseudorhodoferax sp. Leaf267]|nr:hypothetical protein ASF43_11465 [Pseudorhodoferax sp. Leaf267]